MYKYLYDEIKKFSNNFTTPIVSYDVLDFIVSECQVMKDINVEINKLTNDNNIGSIVFDWLWTDCADILRKNGYVDKYLSDFGKCVFYGKHLFYKK